MFLWTMNFLDVFLQFSQCIEEFSTRITIITFVFCYVNHDWLNEWFSTKATVLIFTSFKKIVHMICKFCCSFGDYCIVTIITCLFLLKGLVAEIALKVFSFPIKTFLWVSHLYFFCLHEHSWCESSNFVLEWITLEILLFFMFEIYLQICNLSIEFSKEIIMI